MGEVELVDSGTMETFSVRQSSEQEFHDFMSTNRTGRRNAIPFLDCAMEVQQPVAGCSGQTNVYYNQEDASVNGLAQKLQQMDTSSFLRPSTSGYSPNAASNDKMNYPSDGAPSQNITER